VSHPKPLDDEARAVLAAYAAAEGPRPGAAERSWEALARRIAEGEVVELPAPRTLPSWRWWAAAAGIALAATGGLAAAAIGLGFLSVGRPVTHEPPPVRAEVAPAAGVPTVPEAEPEAEAEAEPASATRPAPAQRGPATRRLPAAAGDSIAEEVRLVRAAREARSPDGALVHLDEHARRFPRGVLSAERMVLKIEALCALHREPDARREATRLRRSFPSRTGSPDPRAPCVRAHPPGEPGERAK
jgi:hypothetical protein